MAAHIGAGLFNAAQQANSSPQQNTDCGGLLLVSMHKTALPWDPQSSKKWRLCAAWCRRLRWRAVMK